MEQFDFTILRELRKRAGLSIGEVSAESGVSAAVISKLERNRTRAELDTLYRLAPLDMRMDQSQGITAAELLNLAEARLSHPLKATAHRNEDFLFREINYKNIRCLHGRAGKGSRVSHPNVHRDDYELCWILDGTLRLTLPSESYELSAGQSLQFDALLEHTYEALTDCELLILHIRKENRF